MNHLETACKDPPVPEPAPAMWRARLRAWEDEVSMVYRVAGVTCTGCVVTPQNAVKAAAPCGAFGFGGPASPSSGGRANGAHRQGVAFGPPVSDGHPVPARTSRARKTQTVRRPGHASVSPGPRSQDRDPTESAPAQVGKNRPVGERVKISQP